MLQLDRQKRSYNKRGNEEIFMRPDGREKESAKYRELDGYVKERVQDSMMAVMNEVSQARYDKQKDWFKKLVKRDNPYLAFYDSLRRYKFNQARRHRI